MRKEARDMEILKENGVCGKSPMILLNDRTGTEFLRIVTSVR